MEYDLLISPDGSSIEYVFDDELIDVFDGEPQTTRRVSAVEPADGGGWTADMTMFGPAGVGVVLGPHRTRTEALTSERNWLRENFGL